MNNIIEVKELKKTFSNGVTAVDGITFEVSEGEIFGFLGPNGAGKTTTIAILTTVLSPTKGSATVAGIDVIKNPMKARLSIGYVSQDLAVDDDLTGYENLRLQAGFYHLDRGETIRRIDEVLEMVDLKKRATDKVETYSGGMRKRLDLACGLIHRPRLLFLDEPTLGLDIQTRQEIWRYINQLRTENGMTIFLTTHYMEEADYLCDRIAIIDYGKIKALDTPRSLKSALGGDRVEISFESGRPEEISQAIETIQGLEFIKELHAVGDSECLAIAPQGESAIPAIFDALAGQSARISAIAMKRLSLDDVFLHHTGRELREAGGGKDEAIHTRMVMRRTRS